MRDGYDYQYIFCRLFELLNGGLLCLLKGSSRDCIISFFTSPAWVSVKAMKKRASLTVSCNCVMVPRTVPYTCSTRVVSVLCLLELLLEHLYL